MRGFFRSNTFKVLVIVAVFVAVTSALNGVVGNTSLASIFGLIVSPMQEVTAELSADELEYYKGFTHDELIEYSANLAEDNANLRAQLINYYDILEENKQYEQALNIQQDYPEFELVSGSVTAKDSTDIYAGFSIDVGYVDGVQVDAPVITANGLVGIVTEVYAMSSKVTTILSEDVSVGARAKNIGESGVIVGDAELALNGLVKFDYLSRDTEVKAGEIITSTGEGGLFPKDLIIGEVQYLGSNEEDISLFAVVKPYEEVTNLSGVFVITNFPDMTEIEDTQTDESSEASE